MALRRRKTHLRHPSKVTDGHAPPNQRGLHARAAAKFVKLAGDYDAEVTVTKDGTSVTGTSIMGLMMLAAAKGTSIRVEAEGPQADDALKAISGLVAGGFDETD